jgi:hypothetical protein
MLMLAKWIMGGPFQGLAAAVILALLPGLGWASGAVVALVALRKNISEVAIPFGGALLVAMLMHWPAGDISQAGTIIAALLASLVLANVRSLVWALLAVGVASVLYMVLVMNLAPGKIDALAALFQPAFEDFVAQLRQANPDAADVFAQFEARSIVVQGMVWVTTVSATAALLLARWLQAKLYNPGGFRAEFHRFRLVPAAAGGLLLMLLLGQNYPEARLVLPCVIVPLLLAGLALVHGLFGALPNKGPLLMFFYVGLVFSAWYGMVILIAAAVIDSFVDFRNRIQKRYE